MKQLKLPFRKVQLGGFPFGHERPTERHECQICGKAGRFIRPVCSQCHWDNDFERIERRDAGRVR